MTSLLLKKRFGASESEPICHAAKGEDDGMRKSPVTACQTRPGKWVDGSLCCGTTCSPCYQKPADRLYF